MNSVPCPTCRQDYIWVAKFRSYSESPFLMCKECDSTWEIGELQPSNSNFEPLAERCERLNMVEEWGDLVFAEFSSKNES
jgi:hypothetical protein